MSFKPGTTMNIGDTVTVNISGIPKLVKILAIPRQDELLVEQYLTNIVHIIRLSDVITSIISKKSDNRCDCGAQKARTTHAHWCSSTK
jgi:hypothetical protein